MINNKTKITVMFPVFDHVRDQQEREIIQIFLQRYRDIDFMRNEAKILSAIEKTADLTGNSDGVVTKILVDHGLRSSRMSLPQEFLDHIDNMVFKYRDKDNAAVNQSYKDLHAFWSADDIDDMTVSCMGAGVYSQELYNF